MNPMQVMAQRWVMLSPLLLLLLVVLHFCFLGVVSVDCGFHPTAPRQHGSGNSEQISVVRVCAAVNSSASAVGFPLTICVPAQ
jgi:hypothetical protein